MARRKGGERVLGPYDEGDKHRVIRIDAKGERHTRVFTTARAAEIYAAELRGDLARFDYTTADAIERYREHLTLKGNKPDSIRQTTWALGEFFFESIPLAALTHKRCLEMYKALTERPTTDRKTKKRTGPPMSADSHRGILAQAKSFIVWCIESGWIRGESPIAKVEGIGKRRPRGKSLGKSGNELRVRETRAWYARALKLADEDDQGAIAALVALLLGMRASEIISRKVGDLDDDQSAGDLLWIPCSKTPAGRRTLEVPEVLRPFLLACAEGKGPHQYLFECEREQDELGKPHRRDWVIDQVHRICDDVKVPKVTAHAMRGQLATLTSERGLAGHMIAATLGHEEVKTTMTAYAKPGSEQTGVNRRGLVVLNGGVQVRRNVAK